MIAVNGSGSLLSDAVLECFSERDQVISMPGISTELPDGISTIINCHQYNDIDRAEYFREDAYRENGHAVAALANVCRKRGILLVQAGTSQVFGGRLDRGWSESDPPEPVNVYGDSKLLAESCIRESGCSFIIIRLPELYSGKSSAFHEALRCRREGGKAIVLKEKWFAPLPAKAAAGAIGFLLDCGFRGIVHYASLDAVDHAHFVRYGFDILSRRFPGMEVELEERRIEDYHRPADPPMWEVLDTSLYRSITGDTPPSWHAALEKLLSEDFVPPEA